MAEATRKYTTLKSDLQASKDQHGDGLRNRKGFTFLPKLNVPARKMQDLKLAFSEFYLSLILLQNYQNLNFTGFRKILKKHDKVGRTRKVLPTKKDPCEYRHFPNTHEAQDWKND